MIEIHLRAIYKLMFHILCNTGGRKQALQIDEELNEAIKHAKGKSELEDSNSGRSPGTERGGGGPTVRGGVGAGTKPDAGGSWNPGI